MSKIFLALLITIPISAWATQAQPVPIPEDQSLNPQFEISGVGIGTGGFATDRAASSATKTKEKSVINFSDSSLVFGAAERLYENNGIGSFAFGYTTTDSATTGTGNPFFLHQALVNYQSDKWELLFGRSDLISAHLIDFPTLRGTDLITFTNPLNPHSDGTNDEEHRYGNVISATWNKDLHYFAGLHAEHLIDSASSTSSSTVNAVGARLEYLGSPGMESVERWQSIGLSYDYLPAENSSPVIHQVTAGGGLNLRDSVVNRLILSLQEGVAFGSSTGNFSNLSDSFRASALTSAASLRYLYSPFGKGRSEIALTLGQKHYSHVDGADSYAVALTGAKSLGDGFDVVAQYKREMRHSALASVYNGVNHEDALELGLLFNFNTSLNRHLLPRRNLLRMENNYVPE